MMHSRCCQDSAGELLVREIRAIHSFSYVPLRQSDMLCR